MKIQNTEAQRDQQCIFWVRWSTVSKKINWSSTDYSH